MANKTVGVKADKVSATSGSQLFGVNVGIGNYIADTFTTFPHPDIGRILTPAPTWTLLQGRADGNYGSHGGMRFLTSPCIVSLQGVALTPYVAMNLEPAGFGGLTGGKYGFYTRRSDASNYITITQDDGGSPGNFSPHMAVTQVSGGSPTVLWQSAGQDYQDFGFRWNGDELWVIVDRDVIQKLTIPFNNKATDHGIYSENTQVALSIVEVIYGMTSDGISNPYDEVIQSPPNNNLSDLGSFTNSNYGLWCDHGGTIYLRELVNGGFKTQGSLPAADPVWSSQSTSPDADTMVIARTSAIPSGFDKPAAVFLQVIKRNGNSISAGPTLALSTAASQNVISLVALDETHIVCASCDLFQTTTNNTYWNFCEIQGSTLVPYVTDQIFNFTHPPHVGNINLIPKANMKGTLLVDVGGSLNGVIMVSYGPSGVTGASFTDVPTFVDPAVLGQNNDFVIAFNETTGECLWAEPPPQDGVDYLRFQPGVWNGTSWTFGTPFVSTSKDRTAAIGGDINHRRGGSDMANVMFMSQHDSGPTASTIPTVARSSDGFNRVGTYINVQGVTTHTSNDSAGFASTPQILTGQNALRLGTGTNYNFMIGPIEAVGQQLDGTPIYGPSYDWAVPNGAPGIHFCVELWATQRVTNAARNGIWSLIQTPGPTVTARLYVDSSNRLVFQRNSAGTFGCFTAAGNWPNDTNPHYYVAMVENDGTHSIYVDGVKKTTTNLASGSLDSFPTSVLVVNPYSAFNGVDSGMGRATNAAIYAFGLTAAIVAFRYSHRTSANDYFTAVFHPASLGHPEFGAAPLAFWPLDDSLVPAHQSEDVRLVTGIRQSGLTVTAPADFMADQFKYVSLSPLRGNPSSPLSWNQNLVRVGNTYYTTIQQSEFGEDYDLVLGSSNIQNAATGSATTPKVGVKTRAVGLKHS